MQHKERYISPYRTVQLIETQAASPENVSYAQKHFAGLNNGAQIWNKVKPLVTFKKDPPTVEVIQGITSFFNPDKNIHSLSGAGDCDCFTSVLASICKANKLPYNYIIQGNSKPSHIAISINGYICDLTNNQPNYLRPYQKTQTIKPMYVQLSDDSEAFEYPQFGGARFDNVAKQLLPLGIAGAAAGADFFLPGSGVIVKAGGSIAQSEIAAKEAARLQRQQEQLQREAQARYNTPAAPPMAPPMPQAGGSGRRFMPSPNVMQSTTEKLRQAAASGNISPGAVQPKQLPVAPMPKGNQSQSMAPEMPGTYVLPTVPITATKINPLFIVGGLAIAYFLFTKKK